MKPMFIGEIKTRSPFGFKTTHLFADLMFHAIRHADMISVHTDPRWGGCFSDVEYVRQATAKPILAKGIHPTDDIVKKALDFGANAVLVVGRLPAPELRDKCFVEPTSLQQLRDFSKETDFLVWNSRDLETGGLKTETWEEASKAHAGPLIQASNIKSMADVKPSAYAFIVGEHLLNFK